MANTLDASNTDLSSFRNRGGKLLVYQGWTDQFVPADLTIGYYERVSKTMKENPEGFYRLFMVPGMDHCQGGSGTDTFDAIGTLDSWVTTGNAPNRIVAARQEKGVVVRTRPLCPYPRVAHWIGSGSTDRADNFICLVPTTK